MKLRALIIVAISLLCVLTTTSCAPESPEALMGVSGGIETIMNNQTDNDLGSAEFFAKNRIENTKSLSDILTVEYAIEDLVDFFGGASSNESTFSGTSILDIRIATANEKFPIECLRQTDSGSLYSVYKVKEGGLYYVFWADIFDNTIDVKDTIVDWAVYFTAYLPTSIKLTQNDFNSIIPNSSTAAEVAFIDPNFELCFLMSSRTASFSLLEDGSVMEICYDFGATLESKTDLIVTSKEILSGTDSSSKLAAVYPYDLP